MNPLQKLVSDRLAELGDSYRSAASRSHNLVSHSTLSRIAAGKHPGRLQADTIAGIALALQLSEAAVLAAAEEYTRPARWVELSAEFVRLGEAQQAEIMALMEKLLDEQQAAERAAARKARPLGG